MTRQIEYEGMKLCVCPSGCDESELELGAEGQSFMAMFGKPYKYLRCGKCKFGDENSVNSKTDMADVIRVWNDSCEAEHASLKQVRSSCT